MSRERVCVMRMRLCHDRKKLTKENEVINARIQLLYCEFSALIVKHIVAQNAQKIKTKKEFQMTTTKKKKKTKKKKTKKKTKKKKKKIK